MSIMDSSRFGLARTTDRGVAKRGSQDFNRRMQEAYEEAVLLGLVQALDHRLTSGTMEMADDLWSEGVELSGGDPGRARNMYGYVEGYRRRTGRRLDNYGNWL